MIIYLMSQLKIDDLSTTTNSRVLLALQIQFSLYKLQ